MIRCCSSLILVQLMLASAGHATPRDFLDVFHTDTGKVSGKIHPYSMSGTVRQRRATGAALTRATVAIAGISARTSGAGNFSISRNRGRLFPITVSKLKSASKTFGDVVNGSKRGMIFFLGAISSFTGTTPGDLHRPRPAGRSP